MPLMSNFLCETGFYAMQNECYCKTYETYYSELTWFLSIDAESAQSSPDHCRGVFFRSGQARNFRTNQHLGRTTAGDGSPDDKSGSRRARGNERIDGGTTG